MGHSKANMEESSQPRAALPVGHDPSRNDMAEACLAHGPLPVKVIHEISQPGPAVHVDVATVVPKQPPFFKAGLGMECKPNLALKKGGRFRTTSSPECSRNGLLFSRPDWAWNACIWSSTQNNYRNRAARACPVHGPFTAFTKAKTK